MRLCCAIGKRIPQLFLAGYEEAAHSAGAFAADAPLRGLLDLFLLEKTLYEIRYELNNRPVVLIPLQGMLSLLNYLGDSDG